MKPYGRLPGQQSTFVPAGMVFRSFVHWRKQLSLRSAGGDVLYYLGSRTESYVLSEFQNPKCITRFAHVVRHSFSRRVDQQRSASRVRSWSKSVRTSNFLTTQDPNDHRKRRMVFNAAFVDTKRHAKVWYGLRLLFQLKCQQQLNRKMMT